MKYRLMHDEKLPVIGQGSMGIGGYFQADPSSDALFQQAIEEGIRCGATFIDTAEVYGAGHSEEIIGQVIKGRRKEVLLSTKFSPEHNRYDDVLKSVDQSLSRLGTDYIDLYQIHWPNHAIPLEETIAALDYLVDSGKVRWIGVSNFSLKELKQAQACACHPIRFLQTEYNVFDRTAESSLLPYCAEHQIFFVAYSPTDQGCKHLSKSQLAFLQGLGKKYHKSIYQVMLNWLTLNEQIIAIPKSANVKHAGENAVSADFSMLSEDVRKFEGIFPKEPCELPPSSIHVVSDHEQGRNVYLTKQQAIKNEFGFEPSPMQLANEILRDKDIKPIRVKQIGEQSYELMEGRIRYWGWVIAFGEDEPIPCLVKKR